MADGYLENKMAEHRATAMRPAGATRKRNALDCAMPEKRVAVIGSPSPLTAALLKIYSESGCRVALLTDCETHELCALYSGIRIISLSSPKAIESLLKVWHDVDILISNNIGYSFCAGIENIIGAISDARKKLPLPNSYGLRVISIADKESSVPVITAEAPILTFNTICIADEPVLPDTATAIARTALYLSLPWAGCISGSKIIINNTPNE